MITADMDRLHSTLSRLEGLIEGYTIEIISGSIVMSPVRPHHAKTIRLLGNFLESALSGEWEAVSEVAFRFDDAHELCPDLAVIPRAEADRNLSSYPCGLIEAAIEVVSPGSVDNDYKTKVRRYAERGIPVYLIFDPYAAHCVAMWEPVGADYASRVTFHYGTRAEVPTPLGRWAIPTDNLPVDLPR